MHSQRQGVPRLLPAVGERGVDAPSPRWGSRSAPALPRPNTSPVPPGGPTRHCPPSRTGRISVSGRSGGTGRVGYRGRRRAPWSRAPGTVVVVGAGRRRRRGGWRSVGGSRRSAAPPGEPRRRGLRARRRAWSLAASASWSPAATTGRAAGAVPGVVLPVAGCPAVVLPGGSTWCRRRGARLRCGEALEHRAQGDDAGDVDGVERVALVAYPGRSTMMFGPRPGRRARRCRAARARRGSGRG